MLYLILSVLLSPEDDAELIARLKRRDPQAMTELYERFGKIALSILVRIVKDTAVAEDLLQETFLKVWNRVDGFQEDRGSLGPWLLAIARNRAIDYLRSTDARLSQTSCNLEALERPKFYAEPESEYHNSDRVRMIRDAFGRLTHNQRQVLELAYFEGLSQSEMAARLNQPLGTVKTWVRTALQLLRDELGESVETTKRERGV